jgi:hypothetical protein
VNGSDALVALGVLGILLGIAGFAGFVVPGLNASFTFVGLVGVLVAVQGLRYLVRRSEVESVATDPGDPERRYRVPAPGDDIRGHAGRSSGRTRRRNVRRGQNRRGRRLPRTLRRRIEAAVVETIRLREHCSIEAAERHVDEGTWTDDPIAARYLGADVPLPLSLRLRRIVARRSRRKRAARTLDALETLRNDGSAVTAIGESTSAATDGPESTADGMSETGMSETGMSEIGTDRGAVMSANGESATSTTDARSRERGGNDDADSSVAEGRN